MEILNIEINKKTLTKRQKIVGKKYLNKQDLNIFHIEKNKLFDEKNTNILNENNSGLLSAVDIPVFTFVDLFAGIGGFRIALQDLGGQCVFSSEWENHARNTYYNNFGEMPYGDITTKEVKNLIPNKFDVLCAGFPCQPFSKGGHQQGFEDTRGTLFFHISEIILKHKPKFLFLENVSNLVTHDKGNTYKVITNILSELGYIYPNKPLILSPDWFGIPILRPRLYLPCVRMDIAFDNKNVIEEIDSYIDRTRTVYKKINIEEILDKDNNESLTDYELKVIDMWDEFYRGIDLKIIGFPVWMEYFVNQVNYEDFPIWKQRFIKKNKELYERNKTFIDNWLDKWDNLQWCNNTHKKFEWQAGENYNSIYECLIQFRPSGVRVKKPDKFSTLVAMNHRQIIGPLRRKISINETKRLQSFPENYKFVSDDAHVFKLLGNSVNVFVVKEIFRLVLNSFMVHLNEES